MSADRRRESPGRFVPLTPPNQLSLPLEGAVGEPALLIYQTVHYERVVKQAAKVAIRQPFPAYLPRVDVLIEPQEDISGMRKIGEEITEELVLKPASLFVRRYIRPRYVSIVPISVTSGFFYRLFFVKLVLTMLKA